MIFKQRKQKLRTITFVLLCKSFTCFLCGILTLKTLPACCLDMQKTWDLINLVYKYLLLRSMGAGVGGRMIGEERGLVNFVPKNHLYCNILFV